MKVVAFGADGWTGRALLSNLTGRHEIRACAYSPESWTTWNDLDGSWNEGEIVFGDISDFDMVYQATEGMEGVVHLARFPEPYDDDNDTRPFTVNIKGLWNVLESARRLGVRRVVHLGSCQTVHPKGVFFTSDVRRVDGSAYAVTKRLQEEMCRQFHEAYGLHIIVLRLDGIVDGRLGIDQWRQKLEHCRNGCVCRHDVAEAVRLSLENTTIDFDILHAVGTREAEQTCNVARTRQLLGLEFNDLEQYR